MRTEGEDVKKPTDDNSQSDASHLSSENQGGINSGESSKLPQPTHQRTPVPVMIPGAPGPIVTDTVYVSFSAEINPKTSESLIATIGNLVNQAVPHVYLMLSTPGGAVMNGLNVYNVLRGLPCELTIHNVGNVDSIGNAIFLAGQRRYACAHSTFMFHGVGFNTQPGERLEEKILRERLASVLADQKRIAGIIEERTNLTGEQANGLFLEAQTKDSAFAVGSGIVHEVRNVDIPAGGPIISLVFQR
jgi:ATP-dependent protease ClpP protease subunit